MVTEENHYKECLRLLAEQWPDLVERIENADTGHLSVVQTEVDEINIKTDFLGQHLYIHDQSGALKESENFFFRFRA